MNINRTSQVNMEITPADGGFDPSAVDLAPAGAEGDVPPPIESFHRQPEIGEQEPVDDRKEHSCTVVFLAPDDIGEAEMMNYIMGIGDALGVEVRGFNWAAKDPKPARNAR